ncbi:MAG: hypothetical protein JJE39_16770 [Vicinamibacteria bacterium]|nr:hypothetical protein [Vicinamibacteria bacterium]
MTRPSQFVSCALVSMLCLSGARVESSDKVVSQSELNLAVSSSLARDDASRATITTLLQRDDVKSLAADHGLDLRRAQAAVGTLQGDELQRVSALAVSANAQLAGGTQSVTISLVAALLIVIIIILVVG